THATTEKQHSISSSARSIAKKVVVVTMKTMDDMIHEAGFEIIERWTTKKGTFSRQILVCE
ncbi:RNA methyltransferase, partial [Bacillus paranthracis]|nr:RNA methyltransferase [Bacillus paranthracis]